MDDNPHRGVSVRAWSLVSLGTRLHRGRTGRDALASVTSDDLRVAWLRLKVEPRVRVVVVGDLRYEEIAPLLERSLGRFPSVEPSLPIRTARVAESQPEPAPTSRTEILRNADSPTWHLASYVRGPCADAPDLAAFWLAMLVLDARL